jgi:hypothetical protein
MMLSSDLEEATDALLPSVIFKITEAFMQTLGLNSKLAKLGLALVTSRRQIEFRDEAGTVFTTSRGILMGEPMTKSLLTLYNLVIEELAIRQFKGSIEEPDEGPITYSWRAFAVGGDDHIAYGPSEYLALITRNHLELGSKISVQKTCISSLAVKFCEKNPFP